MLRKIKRNMARRQLENDGMKHLNKDHKRGSIFSMNWRKAYILRFAEVARKNEQKVEFRRKADESTNS